MIACVLMHKQPMILTFSHVASELGILKSLADSPTPISGTDLAKSSNVDRVLLGACLNFFPCLKPGSSDQSHRPYPPVPGLK